jgi:putative ABC transport system permease protein
VREATPVALGFGQWRMRSGNTTPVFIVASDVRGNGLHPWNIVAGSVDDLSIPGGVAIDRSYFNRLGSKGLGDTAEIRDMKAEVTAVTSGIRSFTTTPYVFTTLNRGRDYVGMMPSKATYFLVHLTPGANVDVVRRRLTAALTDAEVLTPEEFAARDMPVEARSSQQTLANVTIFTKFLLEN